MVKRCPDCGLELPVEAFTARRDRPGRRFVCKACDAARAAAYYAANRAAILERRQAARDRRRGLHLDAVTA